MNVSGLIKLTKVIKIETTIVGSDEQHKFLTIVPWRSLSSAPICCGQLLKNSMSNF